MIPARCTRLLPCGAATSGCGERNKQHLWSRSALSREAHWTAAFNPQVRGSRPWRRTAELGADPYVQLCAAELATLKVAAAPQSPAKLLGLSRAELAVARLVATGMPTKRRPASCSSR